VGGIDYITLLASGEIRENQWFHGVFEDESSSVGGVAHG